MYTYRSSAWVVVVSVGSLGKKQRSLSNSVLTLITYVQHTYVTNCTHTHYVRTYIHTHAYTHHKTPHYITLHHKTPHYITLHHSTHLAHMENTNALELTLTEKHR